MISRRAITFFLLSALSQFGLASSERKSYRESCLLLQKIGQLDNDQFPEIPKHRPQYDDPGPLGVSFFRVLIENEILANLTLPRTYFGKSEFRNVSFSNTDLSESTLCWNDFIRVNFSDSDLSKSDLRASVYKSVKFDRANLSFADLRRSSFENCSFLETDFSGAIATRRLKTEIIISQKQIEQISWTDDEGEEPGGG